MTEINVNINQNDSSLPVNLKENVYIEDLKDSGGREETNKNIQYTGGLQRTSIVRGNIEDFSLDNLGTIENAKKHSSANRPLHKLKEFTESVNFCRCCDLPCEEKGIIEPFHFCDDIDLFSECGLGITLYFYFFRFMALIVFMGMVVLAISMIIFNHNYSGGIIDICKDYTKGKNIGNIGYCEGYIKDSENNTNFYQRFNRWLTRLSSDNIQVYRKLPDDSNWKNKINVNDIVINYSILNFCYLITAFILNIYFIIFIKEQAQNVRLLNLSIRDYSVIIYNAKDLLRYYVGIRRQVNPSLLRASEINVENGKEFKVFVNDYIKGDAEELNDIKLNTINLCYDLGQYMDFRDEYELCKNKIFQIENNPYNIDINTKNGLFGDDRLYYNFLFYKLQIRCCHCLYTKDITENFRKLKKQKEDLEKQLEQEEQNAELVNENNFTGYMFISFDTIKDKELFLSQYPHNFFHMILYYLKNIKYYLFCCCLPEETMKRFRKSKGIDAYDPPEPEDVIWENFKYTERERRTRVILIFLLCIVIMAISLGIVFGLTFVQDILYQNDKEQGGKNIFLKYLISLAIIIVISIINAIFQVVLEYVTHFEKQISRSNEILSASIKISIFTFLNSAIIPLISKHLVLIAKEDEDDYYEKDFRIRERNNLFIDDMFVFFIVNAIFTPLLWTVNFIHIFRFIQRKRIERSKKPDKNHFMKQRDLNKLYLYQDMKIAYKYSYLFKTTAMCLFLMPIFPVGFIIAFIGFIFAYYIEKYSFTHLYRRPQMLDEIVSKTYADFFVVLLFIGGIGDYIFLHNVYDSKKWQLLNIILFGVLIIIPYTKFLDCNFVGIDKSKYHNQPLSSVYFTFYNDYQRQNPLTKKIGLLNYLAELKQYNYLSEKAYRIAEENIDQLNVMEIYYGTRKGNTTVQKKSYIEIAPKTSILPNTNINKSILGRGLLKTTIKPEFSDNQEIKRQKREMLDSQIMNMHGQTTLSKGVKGVNQSIEPINELDEIDLTESKYKDDQENRSHNHLNQNI